MEVSGVTQLISSYGFPIVCCWFMWKYITSTLKELTDTINRNTSVIEKLLLKIEQKEDKQK